MDETRVSLLIRIHANLKAKLVELAKREHRSLNQEIEFLLERSLPGDPDFSTSKQHTIKSRVKEGE